MKILMIDPHAFGFKWAIVDDWTVTERGATEKLIELDSVAKKNEVGEVWIDSAYRTAEVLTTAAAQGWITAHARQGRFGRANMIEHFIHT